MRWYGWLLIGLVLFWLVLSMSKISRIARAIAQQEGFNVPGSRAQRNNNPGNLTLDLTGRAVGKDGPFVVYASAADGMAALEQQVRLMFNGGSRFYDPSMTIGGMALVYTKTQQAEWARNVAAALGVSVDTKLSEI